MRKKHKFLKEKIFYTSLGIFVILLSLVSFSFAFTDTSVIGGVTNPDTIPNVTFDKTDVFTIKDSNTETIDLVLNTPRSTTCTFDMIFYFYDCDKYIKSDDNKININVYDSFNDVLSSTLESSYNGYSKIGSYSIHANGTTTKNITFDVSYNGVDNYNGYITLENVICTTDKE